MSEVKDLLENEIYPALDRAEALADLAPQDKGSYYLLTCPNCRKREAFIYKTGEYITCNRRNKCGFSQSLWDYVQKSKGLTNQETLRELARLAGYTLPELNPASLERAERAMEQANTWESSSGYFQSQLWGEKGRAVLDYLKGRGYTEKEIEAMGLGLFTSTKELKAYLVSKGYKEDATGPIIQTLENISKEHKVVIPYRDPVGRVKGVIVRAVKKDVEPKYLYNKGLSRRDTLFNLDRARGASELIVVEGLLDALIIREKGFKNVIALGDSSFSETKIDQAVKYGAKSFLLALDNDKAGAEGTERALELLRKKDIRAYVVTLPEGIKDPDELIKAKGAKAFRELLSNPQSGARWKAGRLLARYDIGTDKGRDLVLEEAIAYEDGLRDPIETKDFLDVITQGLGISLELLEHRLRTYKEKRAREEQNEHSKKLLEENLDRLDKGEALDLRELEDRVKDLRLETEKLKARPTEILSEHLKAKYERESKREAGELLGYRLNSFREITENADGIQPGFYIIGAYTAKGKTALATNLFMDLLKSNPGVKGLYFSLDDNKDVIINRFLGILTGLELNRIQRKQGGEGQRKILEAYGTLIELAESGSLIVKDISEVNHIDTLEIEIRERAEGSLFVVIDGLYNLETGKGYGGIREENIDRANKVKALVDTYKIPIICTGELRKRAPGESKDKDPSIDDLMETGKFAYNANLVWFLYPDQESKKGYDENPEPDLILKYEKNKLSYFTGKQRLKFKKATGTIIENHSPWD